MSTTDPNDGMTDQEREDLLRARFSWNDEDIRFKDEHGNILTTAQVEKMQADARAEEARIAAHEAEMMADQREQAEARKGR